MKIRTKKQAINFVSTRSSGRVKEDFERYVSAAMDKRKMNIKQIEYLLELHQRYPRSYTLPVVNVIMSIRTYSKSKKGAAAKIWNKRSDATLAPLKHGWTKYQVAAHMAWVTMLGSAK